VLRQGALVGFELARGPRPHRFRSLAGSDPQVTVGARAEASKRDLVVEVGLRPLARLCTKPPPAPSSPGSEHRLRAGRRSGWHRGN